MATQPTVRPWFRLASMARPANQQESQPPASNPLPRPPIIRPTFATSLRPVPPPPSVPAPPPPFVPAPPPLLSPSPPPPPPPPVYPNSSVPPSPTTKALAPPNTVSSVPTSPAPKLSAPASPLQRSPITKSPATASSPNRSNFSPLPSSPVVKAPTTTSSPSPKSPAAMFLASNSVQNSPPQKPKSPNSPFASNGIATSPAQVPTPSPPSHKFTRQPLAQTPPSSPKISANAHPPSPLRLPPSPLRLPPSMLNPDTETIPSIPIESEQKTMMMQNPSWVNWDSHNTVQNPSNNHHGKNQEKGSHYKRSLSNAEDKNGMKVITIAGENRGAFMELRGHSDKKLGPFEGNPYRLNKKNGNESDTSSSEEGKSKTKDKNHKKMMNAYMNSNVQGVNNSIVFNSSYSHHDPGVHLSFSRKP